MTIELIYEREKIVSKAQSQKEKLKQSLAELQTQRAQIIEASTTERLKRNAAEIADIQAMLDSVLRLESNAVSNAPPSPEELELWSQIRELGDREQAVLRDASIPEKYIRPDALEFFKGDLENRRVALEAATTGQSFSSMGPRILEKFTVLKSEENLFATRVRPLCESGEKLFKLRQQKNALLKQRDELRSERESRILASV